MEQPKTILFAGGGTGGHLFPGIAVAEALREAWPEARPLFLCTAREIDRVILEPAGFEFIAQPIIPPQRSISGLLKFWKSWRETKDLVRRTIRERQPAAVLGLGGYAAGVAVKIAALHGVPAALLNPDVIPGQANQYLMRYAKSVCCQFRQTVRHVSRQHRKKLQLTGCPIRRDLRQLPPRADAAKRLGLDPQLHTLVVTGASQGAKTVNDAVLESLKTVTLQGWQVLHLAGRELGEAVRAGYRELGLSARVIDYTPAMADVWAVAELAVSRAGASSCAELLACGVPSILMPYPFHRDMHQRANAEVLAKAGAAVLLEDQKDAKSNAARLAPALQELLYDNTRRGAMASVAKHRARPVAAEAVAEILRRMTNQ